MATVGTDILPKQVEFIDDLLRTHGASIRIQIILSAVLLVIALVILAIGVQQSGWTLDVTKAAGGVSLALSGCPVAFIQSRKNKIVCLRKLRAMIVAGEDATVTPNEVWIDELLRKLITEELTRGTN